MIAAKEDLIIDHGDRFKVLLNRTSEEHWATLDANAPDTPAEPMTAATVALDGAASFGFAAAFGS